MLEELLVQAQTAGIHREIEAQRWARQWQMLNRAEKVTPHRRPSSSGVARTEAGLREGR